MRFLSFFLRQLLQFPKERLTFAAVLKHLAGPRKEEALIARNEAVNAFVFLMLL